MRMNGTNSLAEDKTGNPDEWRCDGAGYLVRMNSTDSQAEKYYWQSRRVKM